MPRAHTPEQRDRIRQRLMQVGREGFVRVGLDKLTIADLARDAGIGKGSFYGFFDSKEALFLAIQEQEEATFKAALVQEIDAASSARQAVVTLLTTAATRLDDHPFMRLLLDPRTLAALSVRVPPERLLEHRERDAAFFGTLIEDWKRRGWLRPDLDPALAFDVLGAIFVISVQRELIGVESSHRATRALAEAVARDWCSG